MEEVKQCIFSIPNGKSPGPDGYSSQFYKDAWDIIGDEVGAVVINFFEAGRLLNQLARILPDIISKNQGAFVKGRSILENILICQDLVRMYNRGMVSPRCMFKLDLQKAYDSIEWQFVDQMLDALNFPEHFRKLIMLCITTPSYTLNLNGSHFGYFHGKRGLGQGDPISPLIFCICMEYLTRINYAYTKGFIYLLCNFGLKVVQKIRGIGARKLSYAGRLILINSVLNTLHNYWASIFLIPKGVIRRIEAICENFFWSGESDYHRVPLIAWEKICCRKKEGGLNIKSAEVWNKATLLCVYSSQLLMVLSNGCAGGSLVQINRTKLRKLVARMALMATWYCIWKYRNECRLSLTLATPRRVIKEIQSIVKARILQKIQTVMPQKDKEWLLSLDIHV
ncbi:uncharacterized protein LOC141607874 [Silene latifolia]|uniref:uncharacterized protein LOC141607874 n=1 Tax=Silene latifolia TaxID=37657 RepID=UPI003D76E16E